ncbi:MAG TPA: TPM domain-containing protein, partial [Candidatus Limnocylindria bacterium]|nr:TPM domain-containing protein [Candidatus Limnocylindria bacterium]
MRGLGWALPIAMALAAPVLALGPPIPPLAGPVVDQAGIIDPASRRRITELALDLERRTGAELAVLTMPSVAPLTAFDYGMQVVDAWKLGKKDRDDGLLLLVVLEPREVRMFTGYGLEGTLPDGRVGAILDEWVVPHFKRGAYGDGIYAGLAAAAAAITGDAP